MSIATLKYVRCDECGAPAQPGDDAREARGQARREGFARRGGRDLCVVCSGRAENYDPLARRKPA